MPLARPPIALGLASLACLFPPAASSQRADGVRVVRSLDFRGNQSIDDRTLRASISTQQASWFHRFALTRWIGLAQPPVFDAREFQRDVLRIQALYGVRGFPDAQVDTTLRRRGDDDIAITVRIAEGEPIRVDSVLVHGVAGVLDPDAVREELPLKAGHPFDRLAFQTSAAVLQGLLHNRGHAFARVTGGFQASADARSVVVELTAEPGPRATIGRVAVIGTEGIDDRVVLKTLLIEPGDVYSDSALQEGMMRLQRTDLFRQVRVVLVDSAPEHPGDSVVDVLVRAELAEYPLRRARLSAGYGTLDCFRSMGSVDLFNFTGHGRRMELRARTAQLGVGDPTEWGFERGPCPMLAREDTSRLKLNYNLAATLHEPLLAWERTSAMATIFAERHTQFGAYLREAVGGEIAVTQQLAPHSNVPLRVSYSIAYGRTVATAATFCALLDVCLIEDQQIFSDRLRRSVLAVALARDRTNSVIDPTRGSAMVAEVRWAPRALGSDRFMRFARVSTGFKSHHPLGLNGAAAGRVFSWRLAAGTVFAPTEQLPSGPRTYAPPEERLYAGGSTTVRGFSENQLGPVVHVLQSDSTIRSSATGGTLMGLANAELRVPLRLFGLRLFGAVFVDAGVVGERRAVRLDDWRVTPGAGLRMASMLGPIRLDLGYNPHPPRAGPLYRLVGTELQLVNADYRPELRFIDRLRLHLSVGQAF